MTNQWIWGYHQGMLPDIIKDKIITLAATPDTLTRICSHVANGGSMIDLCKLWGVPYGVMLEWINDDDDRYKIYQRALSAQMYWAIDTVLRELKNIGTLDLAEAYGADGKLKQIHDMPEHVRHSISSVKTFEEFEGTGQNREFVGYVKEIKIFDKIKALELIGKKFAMFIERSQVDINQKSLEELITESMKPDAIPAEVIPPEQPAGTDAAARPATPPTP